MGENKRYYWLKLQENFFDDDTIDFIEGQENGEKYVLFYLKLCLKALKNEGKLIRYVGEMLLPFDDIGISKLTRTDIDVVRSALTLFSNIGLIKKLDTGEIFLTQLNEMVGTETQKAKYMREKRLQERNKGVTMLPECYSNVTQSIEYRDRVKEKETEQETNNACVPDYITEKEKKINRSISKEFQSLQQEMFNLICEHNSKVDIPKKIPISNNFWQFTCKESRSLLDAIGTGEKPEDIMQALKNFLKVAESETWQRCFSWKMFINNYRNYTQEFFDISKYIDTPKSEEEIKTMTQSFADENLMKDWFNYAIFHHNRKKWIQAGQPEGEDFKKWAEGCLCEDVKNGRANPDGDYN